MAKKAMIQKDLRRRKMVDKYLSKRRALKEIMTSKETSMEEKFMASMEMCKLPRNSAQVRVRNRCALTGRPRGYHGAVGLSRICFRSLAGSGLLPGFTKSSW